MRKLLIFILFILSTEGFGQTLSLINVGKVPNDGTGDPIRTAFIKTNSAISLINTRLPYWNAAYTERLRWSGTATGLNALTGRTSLGGTTIGQAVFTSVNPSAVTFLRGNADNSINWLSQANFKTALSLVSSDVGLGNLTNKLQVELEDSTIRHHGYVTPSALGDSLANTVQFADALFEQTVEFYVTDYGAIRNDLIEDQSKIQLAINAANAYKYTGANVGGTVVIPAGFWFITSCDTLKSYVTIRADKNAFFYLDGTTAGKSMWFSNGPLTQAWVIGGNYYSEYQKWNLIELQSPADADAIFYNHFEDMMSLNNDDCINLSTTNDGWINGNDFNGMIIQQAKSAIKTREGGSSLGIDGNIFSDFQIQADVDNDSTEYIIDGLSGRWNQFNNINVFDFNTYDTDHDNCQISFAAGSESNYLDIMFSGDYELKNYSDLGTYNTGHVNGLELPYSAVMVDNVTKSIYTGFVGAGEMDGGEIDFTVTVSSAAKDSLQVYSGTIHYSVLNMGGAYTVDIDVTSPEFTYAESTAGLTLSEAWGSWTGGGAYAIQATFDTNIVIETMKMTYHVHKEPF